MMIDWKIIFLCKLSSRDIGGHLEFELLIEKMVIVAAFFTFENHQQLKFILFQLDNIVSWPN